MMYIFSARFQLENWNALARLGSAREISAPTTELTLLACEQMMCSKNHSVASEISLMLYYTNLIADAV